MSKTVTYHQAVVQYNQEAMEFFEGLSTRLEDPMVAKWAKGISQQHKFHMNKHLRKIDRLAQQEVVEAAPAAKSDLVVEQIAAAEAFEASNTDTNIMTETSV